MVAEDRSPTSVGDWTQPSGFVATPVASVWFLDRRSALVEEPAGDPLLVLGRNLHVLRRQQEDLARDPLDGAVQAEDQPSREVDQPLGVWVLHLSEVHDDRHSIAEMFADRAGFVVGTRMNRDDSRHVCRPWLGCG